MVVKLNDTNYERPVCWEEVKVRQHQRMISEWDATKQVADRDYFKLFTILTDSDFTKFHSTAINEVTIWNAIRWVIEQPFKFSNEMPKALEIGGKSILLPTKVADLSIGQNIHLRQAIDQSQALFDKDGNVLEYSNYSLAVAIYLQPLIDSDKFNYDRALEIEKDILDMPAYKIRPIGFFIVTNVLQYGRMHAKSWLKTLANHIKTRRRMWLTSLSGNALHLMRTLV